MIDSGSVFAAWCHVGDEIMQRRWLERDYLEWTKRQVFTSFRFFVFLVFCELDDLLRVFNRNGIAYVTDEKRLTIESCIRLRLSVSLMTTANSQLNRHKISVPENCLGDLISTSSEPQKHQ